MSGLAVIAYLLANDAGVTAVVNADNISGEDIALGETLPAISVETVSAVRRNIVAMPGTNVLVTERVQVTVQAGNKPTMKSILSLLGPALPNTSGTVNGVLVDSILPDIQGPDFQDAASTIYMGSRDFIVRWHEFVS